MVNIQFEQAKKMFKEVPIPVGDIVRKNPPEMQCFGFNIADIGLDFRKSQMQFTTYYKVVENPDRGICDNFLEQLLKSPQAILDKIKRSGNLEALQQGFEEFKNTSPEEAKRRLQAEAAKLGKSGEQAKEEKAKLEAERRRAESERASHEDL